MLLSPRKLLLFAKLGRNSLFAQRFWGSACGESGRRRWTEGSWSATLRWSAIVRNTMPSIRKTRSQNRCLFPTANIPQETCAESTLSLPRGKPNFKKYCQITSNFLMQILTSPKARASAQDHEEVLRGRKFVLACNNNAQRDEARRGLTKAQRLALFECEAKTLHKLKGHCELLEAYSWHKLSAERQGDFGKSLLERLGPTEAYFHFDFKENVRYPMSKEETGDEWHAQNKLSLTVFGCVVSTPGRKNFHFLLVSEVLDHDSQMARMLLSRILEIVSSRPAYKWDAVQTLHLVSELRPSLPFSGILCFLFAWSP